MVIADMMDIKNILKDFSRLAEARKNHTFRTRLVFIFCAATIAMVLFFSYRVVNSAMDKNCSASRPCSRICCMNPF